MTAREALIFGRVVSLDLSSDTVQQELGVCPVMAGGNVRLSLHGCIFIASAVCDQMPDFLM